MGPFSHTTAIRLIMLLFVLQPVAMGGWFALIPQVQTALGLSKFELAIALLGMPAALIPTLQLAGAVVARFGPRRVFLFTFPVQAAAAVLPLMASSRLELFLALMGLGAAIALLEVCLNVYAGRLEKQSARLIMNRCHGFWALGLMLGSLLISVPLSDVTPVLALAGLAGLSAIGGMGAAYALPRLLGEQSGEQPARRKLADLPPALLYIAIFMLFVSVAEGAMADWSAVYLGERLGAGPSGAGIAVTIYTGFLALGRFTGDALKFALGGAGLARLTVAIAIIGVIVLVAPLPVFAAYAGLALIGFGISVGYPLGVSAVAALHDEYETANIALMSIVAISGFLIGPPVIGLLSDIFGLGIGLLALVPGLCISLMLARYLTPRAHNPEKGINEN